MLGPKVDVSGEPSSEVGGREAGALYAAAVEAREEGDGEWEYQWEGDG